jgi:hypothetical protein
MDTSFMTTSSENFLIRVVSNMTKISAPELTKNHGILGIQNIFALQVAVAKEQQQLNEVMSILSKSFDEHSSEISSAKEKEIVLLHNRIAELQYEGEPKPTKKEIKNDKEAVNLIAYIGLFIMGLLTGSIFGLSL